MFIGKIQTMKIVRYEVERFTGTDAKNTNATTLFPTQGQSQNPLVDRRAAFAFANNLFLELIDAYNLGITTHQPGYSLGNPNDDRIEVYIHVVYDVDGSESSEVINGLPLNALLSNLEEESDCYLENAYDMGDDSLYTLDASPIDQGYKRVIKDVYDFYKEFLNEVRDRIEKEENE